MQMKMKLKVHQNLGPNKRKIFYRNQLVKYYKNNRQYIALLGFSKIFHFYLFLETEKEDMKPILPLSTKPRRLASQVASHMISKVSHLNEGSKLRRPSDGVDLLAQFKSKIMEEVSLQFFLNVYNQCFEEKLQPTVPER